MIDKLIALDWSLDLAYQNCQNRMEYGPINTPAFFDIRLVNLLLNKFLINCNLINHADLKTKTNKLVGHKNLIGLNWRYPHIFLELGEPLPILILYHNMCSDKA